MRKKLLTVNVITYNHAPYIAECLDSILEQETDFDFIIRIFDDASTDGTQDICRKYKEKYSDIIELFFAEKNLGFVNGVMQNPLRSYQNITTPYYLYIEGDDARLDKDGFQTQVDILETHPKCSFCGAKTTNSSDINSCHPEIKQGVYTKKDIINKPQDYFFINLMSRIVRTECIDIPSENPNFYLTDTNQFFELLQKGNMYFLDKVVAFYRETETGYVSGQNFFERITQNAHELKTYNEHTNGMFLKNLQKFFFIEVDWLIERDFYSTKKERLCGNRKQALLKLQNKPHKEMSKKENVRFFKSIFRTILPGFVPVAIHAFRDWGRELRKNKNTGKTLIKLILPGGIPMAIHYFRNLSRKIRGKAK